jgi:hypothetical protein
MKASILSLLITVLGLFSGKAVAGGEDFPFFCSIGHNTGDYIRVLTDLRSSTGYAVQYYERGRFKVQLPVTIDSTTDDLHFRLRASYQRGMLHDQYLLAFVGKSENAYSSADAPVVRRGRYPSKYTFKPLICD